MVSSLSKAMLCFSLMLLMPSISTAMGASENNATVVHQNARKTIAGRPPQNVVDRFDANTPPTRLSPRVDIDTTIPMLPIGEGPGVLPKFQTATRDFWLGNDPPEQVWETIACPILVCILST